MWNELRLLDKNFKRFAFDLPERVRGGAGCARRRRRKMMRICWECDTTDWDQENPVFEYLDPQGNVEFAVCQRCMEKEAEYLGEEESE